MNYYLRGVLHDVVGQVARTRSSAWTKYKTRCEEQGQDPYPAYMIDLTIGGRIVDHIDETTSTGIMPTPDEPKLDGIKTGW